MAIGDWLADAWQSAPQRSRTIMTRRLAGETLDNIAQTLDLTRERVRQLQEEVETALVAAQVRNAPGLSQQVARVLGDLPAVPEEELAALLPTRATTARCALYSQFGAAHPRAWVGYLPGYLTRDRAGLCTRLREMAALAPMTGREARQAATDIGLPAYPVVRDLLEQPQSGLIQHPIGWIRRARKGRDLAYLWLRQEGEPRGVGDIAGVAGTSDNAIRETMRRDDAFAQVRPEGTWALSDWHVPGADHRYSNAVDAVVEALREHGPLDHERLRTESQRRYPVSAWRIDQCLSSNLIGRRADGLYDLVERGATPIEDGEPRRPKTIQIHGNVLGLELKVDRDLLRGSGILVNRWLTWYLGLRTAPSSRHFRLANQPGAVVVTRRTSGSQISSLRAAALSMGLVEGCTVVVLFHLDTERASLRHTCSDGSCPLG